MKSPHLTLLLASATVILAVSNGVTWKLLSDQNGVLRSSVQTLESEKTGLLAQLEEEKRKAEESISELQIQQNSVRQELDAALEEKTYLEDILIHKTKEIEQYRQDPNAAADRQDIAQRLREKDEQIQRLREDNKILFTKLESLYNTTNQKIAEINIAKIALEETISEARELIEREWNTVDLGSIEVSPNQSATQAPVRQTVKSEGKVLAVNQDHGFVVVDMGRVDGIQNNTKLSLQKDGQEIGTLSVLEVRDVMTACNIQNVLQGRKIEINDLVLVRK